MMEREVSFGVYATCVRAGSCEPPDGDLTYDPVGTGAWDDPSRSNQPAATNYARARAFCLANGGDLPTQSQWIRATEGDGETFGIKDLTDAYLLCLFGQHSPLCDAVNDATWTYKPGDPRVTNKNYFRGLPDVGTSAWDVGPYGHRDMFGSAAEWVRPYARPAYGGDPSTVCSEGVFEDDFYIPYADPPPRRPYELMHIARDLSQETFWKDPLASEMVYARQGSGTSGTPERGEYWTGFRCAFPPLP